MLFMIESLLKLMLLLFMMVNLPACQHFYFLLITGFLHLVFVSCSFILLYYNSTVCCFFYREYASGENKNMNG